ncbi:hypothetical protein MGYG_05045 [Nannizzia gypsea CBS 118893]|uniref:Uncharacterized protein n=1 Tax=Arthroderma gypseum (strain ATCC MYA-4604 / CBS 118893) TaxID=535722 RepID=E4UY80_ARTGP|nr:hypothetical protein MGYG_05045 [Nannizzia gypsea CBS 118893]EFR02043.1 hypothetical protein MGYG_05045 [Nannizzia gypsea CBS 118893]
MKGGPSQESLACRTVSTALPTVTPNFRLPCHSVALEKSREGVVQSFIVTLLSSPLSGDAMEM